MNTPALFFSLCRLGNFSYKNENAGPFLCSSFKEEFVRPNLISTGRSNIVHESARRSWAKFVVR
jgi:hypothetical protein